MATSCIWALAAAGCTNDIGDGVRDGLVECPDGAEFCAADFPQDDEPGGEFGTQDDADDEPDGETDEADIDLPYDIKMILGETYVPIIDAFLEKGAVPDNILEVTMEDGSWRMDELVALESFEVTEADCNHDGNRDIGRDRIFVTWETLNGDTETDHLDLRYCED